MAGGPTTRAPIDAKTEEWTSRRRQVSQTQATIDCVQRAHSHCDQFSSQHAEPWKAVRGKDGCFHHVRNAQVDRGEDDQEDQRADRITDDTVKENGACSPLRT